MSPDPVVDEPQIVLGSEGDIVINEMLFDPGPGMRGDANCDGMRDAIQDEFIELINVSDNIISLDGAAIWERTGVQHLFEADTALEPGAAIVVFGGGSLNCVAAWDGMHVVVSSTGKLALNNGGDDISLIAGDGTVLDTVSYGPGNIDASYVRQPELSGEFVTHEAAHGSAHSPGRKGNGSPF